MELSASGRDVLGKKVRFLRRQGLTPVHLCGHNVEPMSLQCDTAQLKRVLVRTGTTGLIDLTLDEANEPKKVMVREVQRDPISGELLHVDFYQVSMEERIRVEVPIVPVGEAPALKSKENFLAQELNALTIECLPGNIPSRVELDLSVLAEADQAIHVKDIKLGEGIAILNNPEQLIAKIGVGFIEKPLEEKAAAEIAPEAAEETAKEEGGAAS